MATKRPHDIADGVGTGGTNDENKAVNIRQLKPKVSSGLAVRPHSSQQPKIDNVFKAYTKANKKAPQRPVFEVFRDDEEPARKRVTPPRVPFADITHSSNSDEKKRKERAKNNEENPRNTQDSGVDVVFIGDDMEMSIGSPQIECDISGSEAEEDILTFVTAPEPETSKKSEIQLDSCYFGEIFNYLREREENVCPRNDFMSRQTEISSGMRAILVDWLSDVCTEYNVNVASLFLTVSIVDRMLSNFDCPKNKLQLIGAGALFIATKIEEIYPPSLADLVYTTADCYTKKQILRAEKLILQQLKFDICAPCRFWFGTFFAKKIAASQKVDSLMRYFLELSLMSDEYLKYRPSEVGLAALHLANQWINPNSSVDDLLDRANVLKEDINPIMDGLVQGFKSASTSEHQSIFLKYSTKSQQFHSQFVLVPSQLDEAEFLRSHTGAAIDVKFTSLRFKSAFFEVPEMKHDALLLEVESLAVSLCKKAGSDQNETEVETDQIGVEDSPITDPFSHFLSQEPVKLTSSPSPTIADAKLKAKQELDEYFSTPPNPQSDPYEFWASPASEIKFPLLRSLACCHFSAPATSPESERLFSAAGLTISDLRTNLLDETLAKLLFLHSNMRLLGFD
ncbi:hypothetical protein QR680_013280 [Steinernema hermaphroditum]|uniref:Cyclin N-terminal domain-containing protein n=1 Tax=Steinernema hermaphroditum TaxID=289476 RepID=A0AA39I4Z3_9BILA|nr:hypothetical protein QR680_013280 [Steinernema hermaphroditum]